MTRKVTMVVDGNGVATQGALHPLSTTIIAFTDTAGVNADSFVAEVVRLIATEDCYVKFGDGDIVATSSDMLIKANQPEYFTLRGEGYISAIRVTSSGNLFVTVMC